MEIDASRFSFIGYPDPEIMFRSRARPLRVIEGNPASRLIENAIYMPRTSHHVGCIYDSGGGRLDESCIVRGTKDLLRTVSPRTIKVVPADLPVYEAAAIYLGHISSHYGHFLIESLARAWVTIGCEFKDMKCLMHVRDPSVLELPHIKRSFEALGVSSNRILRFDRPTLVRQIVLPNVSFQANSHVYDAYKATMQTIATACNPGRIAQTDQPLYVSRSQFKAKRRTHSGEAEVEHYIKNRGGRVFHPQKQSFDEQILAFNQHKVIVGINGSAMHNLAFSMSPLQAVQFAGDRVPPNHFLIDACFAVRSTYCWSLVEPPMGYLAGMLSVPSRGYARLVKVPPFNLLRRFHRPSVAVHYQLDYDKAIDCIRKMNIFS
jgi:hypothetical protein